MSEPRYKAFLSYHHGHRKDVVATVHRDVQRFGRPLFRPSAIRLYRDRTDLSANPGLWPTIQQALAHSEYLVLFASPESAASTWVQRELAHWIELHEGKARNLLIVLLDGTIAWDTASGDFDWTSTNALPRSVGEEAPVALGKCFEEEPFYVDLSWVGGKSDLSMRNPAYFDAVVTLSSTLHGRPKADMMWQDAAEHRKSVRAWQVAAVVAVLTLGGVAWAVLAVRSGFRNVEASALAAQQELRVQREKNLYEELQYNLRIANLHLGFLDGLVSTGGPYWPPDQLRQALGPLRLRITESPFREVQFAALQAQPELVPEDVWSRAQAFYHQVRAVEDARRDAFRSIDLSMETAETAEELDVLGAGHSEIELFADLVATQLNVIETEYHSLQLEGQLLGHVLEGSDSGIAELGALDEFLTRHSEYFDLADRNEISTSLRGIILQGHPIWGMLDVMFENVAEDDLEGHLTVAGAAIGAGDLELARTVFEAVRTRFADQVEMVRFAEGALFKLDHPELFTLANGVLVTDFAEESRGRDNGIRVGDFLMRYDATKLQSIDDLGDAIEENEDRSATLLVLRGQELLTLEVPAGTLGVSVKQFSW